MTTDLSEYTLTSRQVAERLRIDQSTVTRWAREGKIPCVVTLGGPLGPGHRRYRPADIDALARRLETGDRRAEL